MNNQITTTEGNGMASARRLLRHARRLYSVPDVPEHTNRHNRKQWARSVALLGDRWVYAVPVARKVQS